jgi:hypothetical protein
MALPILTVLQSLILTILFDAFSRSEHGVGDGEISGLALRGELKERKVLSSGPAFYQCMSRLVDAGFVVDRYESVEINRQKLREKRYRITGEGIEALTEYNTFHASIARPDLIPGWGLQGS